MMVSVSKQALRIARPARQRRRSAGQHGRAEHPGGGGWLSEGPQHLSAGLFAASAGLAADPAVRVHLSVPLALVAACLADGRAGLQQWLSDAGVVPSRAAYDRGSGRA